MLSSISIRAAKVEDIVDIAHVHVEIWRSSYRGIVKQSYLDGLQYSDREKLWTSVLGQDREKSKSTLHVAFDEAKNRSVGFVSSGPKRGSPEYRYDGEIYAIYLLEEYKRLGLGSKLFDVAVSEMKRDGFQSAMLWVLKENPSAKFYEKLGGKVVAEESCDIGGEDKMEVLMAWDKI